MGSLPSGLIDLFPFRVGSFDDFGTFGRSMWYPRLRHDGETRFLYWRPRGHARPSRGYRSHAIVLLASARVVITTLRNEVFEAFWAIEIPEDERLKAAAALSRRDDDVSTLKSDMALMQWMMGFVLAFQIGIFVKLFIH